MKKLEIKVVTIQPSKGCCFGGMCEYAVRTGGCSFMGYCKFQF